MIYLYLTFCKTPTCQVLLNPLFGWQGQPGRVRGNATLCRDCACRTHEHVVKCDFSVDGRRPLARNNGRRSKTGVNLEVWNLRCNRFERNEKLTAKTCLKLRFGNVKGKCRKTGVKLHFGRSNATSSRKMKVGRQNQWQNCDFETSAATLSHNEGRTSKTLGKIAILKSQMQHFRAK